MAEAPRPRSVPVVEVLMHSVCAAQCGASQDGCRTASPDGVTGQCRGMTSLTVRSQRKARLLDSLYPRPDDRPCNGVRRRVVRHRIDMKLVAIALVHE